MNNSKSISSGYTTLFREYDPEIARWRSPDPKLKDFPSESPFSAMGNNPIMNTDVLGDDYFENQKTGAVYHNNIYSAKDVNKIEGSNWAHLGGNDMFMANVYDNDNSDAMLLLGYDKKHTPIKIISNNGKGPLLSNIRDGGTMTETWLNPKQAKQFMSDRGYDFKPLEEKGKYTRTIMKDGGVGAGLVTYRDNVEFVVKGTNSSTYVQRGTDEEVQYELQNLVLTWTFPETYKYIDKSATRTHIYRKQSFYQKHTDGVNFLFENAEDMLDMIKDIMLQLRKK